MDPPGSVRDRLRSLIGNQDRQMRIHDFAETMQKRSPRPRGSGNDMIYRYLREGGPTPPLEFIAAAADVLGVQRSWLAFGDPPTEAEADLRVPSDVGRVAPAKIMQSVWNAGEEVVSALTVALAQAQPKEVATKADLENLAQTIVWVVRHLAEAIRPNAPPQDMAAVFLGILAALLAYVPGPGKGRSISEIVHLLPGWRELDLDPELE